MGTPAISIEEPKQEETAPQAVYIYELSNRQKNEGVAQIKRKLATNANL